MGESERVFGLMARMSGFIEGGVKSQNVGNWGVMTPFSKSTKLGLLSMSGL